MTIREMLDELRATLSPEVGDVEARAMAEMIVEDIKGYTKVEVLLNDHRELLDDTVRRMRQAAAEVVAGAPLQYALGSTYWHGRKYIVDSNVLIPRPETSQLIDLIVDRHGHQADLRVLDIGTGSGCIAVSLALDLTFPQVDAVDISAGALDVAKRNALALKAKVKFIQGDAFDLNSNPYLKTALYDIIVSNPPYVLESERPSIDARVKWHEPSLALFVDDSKPIAIYTAIANYAAAHLCEGGYLYFEINPLCVDALVKMLSGLGFDDITTYRDYRGIYRFISCKK